MGGENLKIGPNIRLEMLIPFICFVIRLFICKTNVDIRRDFCSEFDIQKIAYSAIQSHPLRSAKQLISIKEGASTQLNVLQTRSRLLNQE